MGGSSGVISTLNGSLNDDTAGTGGSGTSITLSSVTGFPTSGTIKLEQNLFLILGLSNNDLTGITRAVAGTRSAHSSWSFRRSLSWMGIVFNWWSNFRICFLVT